MSIADSLFVHHGEDGFVSQAGESSTTHAPAHSSVSGCSVQADSGNASECEGESLDSTELAALVGSSLQVQAKMPVWCAACAHPTVG